MLIIVIVDVMNVGARFVDIVTIALIVANVSVFALDVIS